MFLNRSIKFGSFCCSQILNPYFITNQTQTMNSNSKAYYTSVESAEPATPMIEFGDVRVVVDDNKNVNSNGGRAVSSSSSAQKGCYEEEQNAALWSRRPVNLPFCPHCAREHIRTRTRTYPSLVTWACVGVGVFAFFPLCWVPLVVDNLKKTDHYCQSCGQKIGSIKPMENVCVKEES